MGLELANQFTLKYFSNVILLMVVHYEKGDWHRTLISARFQSEYSPKDALEKVASRPTERGDREWRLISVAAVRDSSNAYKESNYIGDIASLV